MTIPIDPSGDDYVRRVFARALGKAPVERKPLRALLQAYDCLALAVGKRLGELRDSDDAVAAAHAEAQASAVLVAVLREALELLGDRLDKLPERQRPHYTPVQRFRILRLKHTAQLTQDETARLFRVAAQTIARWEVQASPDSQTVGSTVTPKPPIRRFNDTVQHLVQSLAGFGFGGCKAVAQHLALAGWRVSRTSVRRYVKGPRLPGPPVPTETKNRPVKANFPHHVWHLDFTRIQAFLRSATFSLATLFDSFSRMPLAWTLFDKPATAEQMCTVIDQVFAVHGKPRHLIADLDSAFTAERFREHIAAWRVNLRFCAADHHRANSKLERFWRSLKRLLGLLPPVSRPLTRADLERDVERAIVCYAFFRPHQGLGGATPAEVYLGNEPAHLKAVSPPRGKLGDPRVPALAVVAFLDGDQRFPFLQKVA